jgi:Nitroreductase family
MISSQVFEAILQAAIAAPSPDNNQPWLFKIDGDGLFVYLDKARSIPSDVKSMFDMTSIGAAVENAIIAAAQMGYEADLRWLGHAESLPGNRPLLKLNLRAGADRDPLFAAIATRCTCRKMYSSQPLETELLKQVTSACSAFQNVQVDWLTTAKQKASFGQLIASADALRFQHQPFHEELFRQLRFNRRDVQDTADGLDVKTLELPAPLAVALPLLRSWKVMRGLIACGMLPLLARPSLVSAKKCGAIAVVSVPASALTELSDTAHVFMTAGRAIERLWLAATAAGLSMHPMGSLSIFLLQPDPRPDFRPTIEHIRGQLRELLPSVQDRVIQLAFRVGRSAGPTARSIRRPPTLLGQDH